MKRLFDIVCSALGLVTLSPVFLCAALAIVIDSGRPVIFCHKRVGRDRRIFLLFKFRTMRSDRGGTRITVGRDQRVTRVGRVLRRTKIDELPQLWNVLCGDMSLVGPRPEIPEYVSQFSARYDRILAVRPGITDLASIRFHNEEEVLAASGEPLREYAEHVLPIKLDLAEEYIRTASFFSDLAILLRTAFVIVRK